MDNLLKQFAQSSQLAGRQCRLYRGSVRAVPSLPDSVDPKWKAYFDGFNGRDAGDVPHSAAIAHILSASKQAANAGTGVGASDERERNVGRLITAYRSRGHLGAQLDPLGLTPPVNPPDLDLPFHSLSQADLDSEFSTGGVGGQPRMKLKDLLARLKATYASTIGAEFMHIPEFDQRQWIYKRLEDAGGKIAADAASRKRTLERLTAAEGLSATCTPSTSARSASRWKAATH